MSRSRPPFAKQGRASNRRGFFFEPPNTSTAVPPPGRPIYLPSKRTILLLPPSGMFGVFKRIHGVSVLVSLRDWSSNPAINTTGPNVIKATAEGSTLSLVINGTLVWTGSDSSPLPAGRIGVGGSSSPFLPATHYFDDIIVGSPPSATSSLLDLEMKNLPSLPVALSSRPVPYV